MAYKHRDLTEIKDNEDYRLDNLILSGSTIKYLINRSKFKGKSLGKYASFLVDNLVKDYAERNPNPKAPNDLINSKWSEQVEINDNTLKSKLNQVLWKDKLVTIISVNSNGECIIEKNDKGIAFTDTCKITQKFTVDISELTFVKSKP